MAVTTGAFQNQYTFSIVDNPGGFTAETPLIEANAIAVINYLSDFISWNGTLDFVVQFGDPFMFGHNGTGLVPAFGGIAGDNHTIAASEAFTGIDANGATGDAGSWLLPNSNGTLTNYGTALSFDPTPDPYEIYSPPAGTHDFFSIYLHEVMHSLGFWSVAQHGPAFGQSTFDSLTQEIAGSHYFTGANVNALLGQNLKLAQTGSRDHYGGVDANLAEFPFVDRGTTFEFGNYANNRWHLGQLELAVLADLGWTTANAFNLAVVELADQNPNLSGNSQNNSLYGDHQQNVLTGLAGADRLVGNQGDDSLSGGAGDDLLNGGTGNDILDGGTDFDTVSYENNITGGVSIDLGVTVQQDTGSAGLDTITNVEAVVGTKFNDVIAGDGANNTLDGGIGSDTLTGGLGDDTYILDSYGDIVTEAIGEGFDTILTSFNVFATPGAEIERIETTNAAGTDALVLVGNEFAQVIVGNEGSNVLSGLGGIDYTFGGGGNDFHVVDNALDLVFEAVGEGTVDGVYTTVDYTLQAGAEIERFVATPFASSNDVVLTGNEFGQVMIGNQGNNVINGEGGVDSLYGFGGNDFLESGAGNDNLFGGTGLDTFMFSETFGTAGGIDRIYDLTAADDIRIDSVAQVGLVALTASQFQIGTAADDATDRVIYDDSTGVFWFDADGNGAGAAILFGVVNGAPTGIDHTYFELI